MSPATKADIDWLRYLFRTRQFYETDVGDEKVSPPVTQLSWTHNLLILSRSNRDLKEPRAFSSTLGRSSAVGRLPCSG
jgi:hypothetical protein